MDNELYRALFDPTAPIPSTWPHGAWGTLLLFLIPVGGGIPAGVLMARDHGVGALLTVFLYFVSDVILAFVFEPVLRALMFLGRWVPAFGRAARAMVTAVQRSIGQTKPRTGVLGLVLVAFGVDPMTGRAAAAAAGHGFVPGWGIAITGDLLYFAVLMVSTLWLDGILGDERYTIGAVLILMFVVPSVIRRWQSRRSS